MSLNKFIKKLNEQILSAEELEDLNAPEEDVIKADRVEKIRGLIDKIQARVDEERIQDQQRRNVP